MEKTFKGALECLRGRLKGKKVRRAKGVIGSVHIEGSRKVKGKKAGGKGLN